MEDDPHSPKAALFEAFPEKKRTTQWRMQRTFYSALAGGLSAARRRT
jgi:hypothetical protein